MIDKTYFKIKILEHVRIRPGYKSEILERVLQGFYPGTVTPNYVVMAKYANAAMKELINTGVLIYRPKTILKINANNA